LNRIIGGGGSWPSITQSSMNTGENIKTIFSNVNEEFSKAVIDSEEKLKGISDNVFNSFGELRDTFSTKVIDTLNQELLSILKRLEISEVTTQEFWDQARKKTLMTMKDLWFVRSIEGAKAHISEEILKAKMRILIVAPEITDINSTLLQQIPRHVNVRIATHIDLSNPEHESIVQMFDGMHNVAYRHREMKNLFGINRDYEEVILCVVSQAELAGQLITEIGGIGSITPEHIKIFTPVLEEAWIGARKEVMTGVRPSFAQRAIPDPSLQPQINEPSIVPETQIPSPETPATTDYLQQYRNTSPSEASETPVNQPYQDSQSNNYQQNEFIPEPSHEIDIPAPIDPTPNYSQPSTPTITPSVDVSTLGGQYENIINNLGSWTGIEISKNLGEFHNTYVENRGYNSVLKQIQMTIGTLQLQSHILSQGEIAQIKKKLVFWKKKLNV